MSGRIFAIIITCSDSRLHRKVNGKSCIDIVCQGLKADPFLICQTGGIQDLVAPLVSDYEHHILKSLNAVLSHNGSNLIVLLNHEDCLEYKRRYNPDDKQNTELYLKHLREAKDKIRYSCNPEVNMKILTFFAERRIDSDTEIFVPRLIQ